MTNWRNDAGSFTASGSALLFSFGLVVAAALVRPRPPRRRRRFGASGSSALAVASAIAFCTFFSSLSPPCFAFCTVLRLTIPRTGRRSEKIQPTPGHRLRADEPAGLEQPLVLRVELLERVVRQDGAAGAVRDLQQEPVAAPDRAGRRRDDLARGLGLRERGALGRVDAVLEARVDDDGRDGAGVLAVERGDGFLELGEAGLGAALGRQVGAVDHEMVGHISLR